MTPYLDNIVTITDALDRASYLESITSLIIVFMLQIQNFTLYKNKLKDDISILTMACILLGISELGFIFATDNDGFTSTIVFLIYYLAFTFVINSYQRVLFSSLNINFSRKWMKNIVGIFLLVITLSLVVINLFIPVLFVVVNGVLDYGLGALFIRALYRIILFVDAGYLFIYYFKNKKTNPEKAKTSSYFLFFSLIIVLLIVIQIYFIGSFEASLAMAFAVALSYLLSKLNIKNLLELQTEEARIQADMNQAANIQQSALPTILPAYKHHPEISLEFFIKPAKEVGGDFYDYFEIDENHLCFLVADVSGKGMPAALFMMQAKSIIRSIAATEKHTDTILNKANQMLVSDNKSMLFVTVWLGILNIDDFTLEYTSAGHNPPFFAEKDGKFRLIPDTGNTVLGTLPGIRFNSKTLSVSPGDRLVIYTDGLTEAKNSGDEMIGTDLIINKLNGLKEKDGKAIIDSLFNTVNDFTKDREQFDDITILAINIPDNITKMQDDFDFDF